MVIAIIGVLAAVVLASFGSARNKGVDSTVKANLDGTRPQAELYYVANGNSYTGVCATVPAANVKTINSFAVAAQQAYNGSTAINTTYATAGSANTATCHVSTATGAGTWALEAPLKVVSGSFFCVDSFGYAATTSGSTLGANDTTCGP